MKTFFSLGLIGYPLGHSLSPRIHKAALDSCMLEGSYSMFPVHPEDGRGLNDLLARVRRGEFAGLNVTIPHKQSVIPLLDRLTPAAQAIGAVNTIFLKNGKLSGDNTDAKGFLSDLKKFLATETQRHGDPKSVLVLGAGGSARAVVYALMNAGWDITLVARRPEQANELVSHFSMPDSRIVGIEYKIGALQSLISSLSLIVNTTPVGMYPEVDSSPWPESLPFPQNSAIYDLVYNPRETKLVQDARAAGLSATTGLGMLIEQAALSFEIWTDQAPSPEILWNAVEN